MHPGAFGGPGGSLCGGMWTGDLFAFTSRGGLYEDMYGGV